MSGLAPAFDLLRPQWPILAASDEPARRTLNVLAPYSGELIAQVALAGERHVQDALFAAFSMFRQKERRLSIGRRIAVLEQAARILQDNAGLLAREVARETGKALRWCAFEVERVIECARVATKELLADSGDELPIGPVSALHSEVPCVTFEQPEPLGVVVAVLPQNNPLELAARALFAAVAAGCPVIVAPSEGAPLSCLRLVHVLHEAGLPYFWCQSLITEADGLMVQLVTDPRVGLVSFCGPSQLGWSLRSRLPPGTRCVLDHGSVVPAIVASDADLAAAAEAIVSDGLMQCAADGESIQRVFVLRELCEAFSALLVERANRIVVGDPLQPDTELGALASGGDGARVQGWVDDALIGGAVLLCGGAAVGRCGYLPTVLLNPPIDSDISTQPVCAPLVAVYAVDTLDEACDRANALPLVRSALLFSSDYPTIERLFRRLDATNVVVNANFAVHREKHRAFGLRRSGLGGSGVSAARSSMQVRKSMVLRAWVAD